MTFHLLYEWRPTAVSEDYGGEEKNGVTEETKQAR